MVTDVLAVSAVYRRVAVEETVLSYVSCSGVHAKARLLELHQGQSTLTLPGGEIHIIQTHIRQKTVNCVVSNFQTLTVWTHRGEL